MLTNADEGAEARKIFIKGSFKATIMWIEMQTWGLTIGTSGLDNPGFKWLSNINCSMCTLFSFSPLDRTKAEVWIKILNIVPNQIQSLFRAQLLYIKSIFVYF